MASTDLERLLEISKLRIDGVSTAFIREIYRVIEWNSRLILLKGCRGVGKTYLMLQHLKMSDKKSLFFSLDHIYFLTNRLSDVLGDMYKEGFRVFALDEIHKYPDWSIELKNIYDSYADVKLVVTSSSALNILAGTGDLSRRMDAYVMRGLSFPEYMVYEHNMVLPTYTFDEMLTDFDAIYESVYHTFDIEKRFRAYLKKGYYPFYKEAGNKYHERLAAVVLQVIDSDMAAIFNIDYASARQIKKLLALISRLGPFAPNITKLSRDLAMSRNSVLTYLNYLSEAGIIHILKSEAKSDSTLTKPDKVFMENTNLLYAFDSTLVNTGTLRETFVFNALVLGGYNVSTPAKGDFMIDNAYVLEVGGPNKDFHQLSGMPNAVLIKEGTAKGAPNVLPMWMLALLKKG